LNEGSLAAGPAKKVMGIPLVMDLQGSLVSEVNFSGLVGTNEFLFSAFKFVEVLSQNLADHIIVSSPILKRTVERFAPRRIITVVPDCVQSSLFSPRKKSFALMQALAIPRNRFIIVYLGSLSKVQGIDLLLGAAKIALQENHDLHFVVMGFPNEASYRFMADSLEISDRVTFTGGVPLGLVPQYLAMGDLAISPKRESSESNGKLLNYMAMGLASVVFDNETNRFLAGDSAIYAKSETESALAESILDAASNERLRETCSRVGIDRAKSEFSLQVMRERILSIYRRLW